MKLSEIKSCLIESFFEDGVNGVQIEQLETIFESIGNSLDIDLSVDYLSSLHNKQSNQSSDPSKAFKRFTEGRVAMLTIFEEDGNAIFAAVRSGINIKISDLTIKKMCETTGKLLSVKNAIKQAKNKNDEVFFEITTY